MTPRPARISFLPMVADLIGFDSFTLKGDPLSRAMAALRVARQHVRLAYADTQSPRLEDVLSDIDDEIGVRLSQIADAEDAGRAELEASGEAEKLRQPWLPLRVA